MNKFFIVSICFLLTFSLHAAQNSKIKCVPQLQKSLNAILKIPEARTLIHSIQKEGPIQIVADSTSLSKQFGAYWDPDNRIICIDLSANRTEGAKIGSLLFELHNASVNSKIFHLNMLAYRRKINKQNYIQSMEHLEYINSINTAKIADKGIKMGVIPKDSRLSIYSSFEEHFRVQRMSGHSDSMGRMYDLCLQFKPYH